MGNWMVRTVLTVGLGSMILAPAAARAEDKLLTETVDFTGTILFLQANVPGVVIGAVRNGETVVRGFGKIADGSDKEPDGDTRMRVGSITKVFSGATLASMVADGKIAFTDRLQDRLGWDIKIPERDGKSIRLIDLATQASGLPREAEGTPGENPAADRSKEDYVNSLTPDALSVRTRHGHASTRISASTCSPRLSAMPPASLTRTSSRSACSRRPALKIRASTSPTLTRAERCRAIISTARPCRSCRPRR